MTGPDHDFFQLMAMHNGFVTGRALHLAAEIGVADALAGGPRDVDELAAATGTNPGALYRLLRVLASDGVFTEFEPRRFALTGPAELLRTDHPRSLRSFLRLGQLLARAFNHAEDSLRTGEPGFDEEFGMSMFDYLRANPEMSAIFAEAMSGFGADEEAAIVAAYDFADAGPIVDVGGGLGTLLRAILSHYPEPTGVLFDQPSVVPAARELLAAAGLAERCAVVAGDFFAEVSPGRMCLLKSVVHDWPDDEVVTILRNCRAALPDDGRLLIIAQVIPPGDEPHPGKPMDLIMLVQLGGRERTEAEHAALLDAAGFRVSRIVPTASSLSIIEAVPN